METGVEEGRLRENYVTAAGARRILRAVRRSEERAEQARRAGEQEAEARCAREQAAAEQAAAEQAAARERAQAEAASRMRGAVEAALGEVVGLVEQELARGAAEWKVRCS